MVENILTHVELGCFGIIRGCVVCCTCWDWASVCAGVWVFFLIFLNFWRLNAHNNCIFLKKIFLDF